MLSLCAAWPPVRVGFVASGRPTLGAPLGISAHEHAGGEGGVGGPPDPRVPVGEDGEQDEDPEHDQADPQNRIRHRGQHLRPGLVWSVRPASGAQHAPRPPGFRPPLRRGRRSPRRLPAEGAGRTSDVRRVIPWRVEIRQARRAHPPHLSQSHQFVRASDAPGVSVLHDSQGRMARPSRTSRSTTVPMSSSTVMPTSR